MMGRTHILLALALILSPAMLVSAFDQAGALPPANDPFFNTWARSDRPVSDGVVQRTWMWGPEANTPSMMEAYADAPGGEREVRYFDKTRMEINNPAGDPVDPWYVTNGLLATELMTGRVQVGDDDFIQRSPAEIPVAGDSNDESAPTYATMNQVRDLGPRQVGGGVVEEINRAGQITTNLDHLEYSVQDAYYVPETDHTVASVFWEFMNSAGIIVEGGEYVEGSIFPSPFFATGFPVTGAYWTTVSVAGQPTDVLVQVFERRVLTYAPENPEGWRVEAGNVGIHYHHWVYEILADHDGDSPPLAPPPGPDATPTPEPVSTATPVPTPTPEPTATPSIPDNTASCLNSLEQEFLQLINQYRQDNGLAALANSESLNIASYKHSEDMGVRDYFDHETPEGIGPFERMAAEGYDYNTFKSENIAAGYPTAQDVFEGWRNSPGHNQNMLSPHVAVIGIARVEVPGSYYGIYWTTKFGGHVDVAPSC